MNLIEQLGGYEKAKSELKDKKWRKDNLHGSAEFTWHMKQHMQLLESVLLEYRRQHNIFEVGDWITSGNETYQILSIEYGDLYKVANNTYCESGCFSHATPEEIKAGKRL